MTAPRDADSWLRGWMSDAAGEPATGGVIERFAVEVRHRPPRAAWLARIHDRWTHGGDPLARPKRRTGLLAIAAVTLLTLAGLFGQLLPGGSDDRKALAPAIQSPVATSGIQPTTRAVDVGAFCRSDVSATLPPAPLPVTSRPTDLPVNDGLLALGAVDGLGPPTLLDPVRGTQQGISITSDGKPVNLHAFVLPGWSPDGRWLALRLGYSGDASCTPEVIVSPDGARAVDVTHYPPGRSAFDGAWSPDGRWIAVTSGDRIDVFAISPDGTVSEARTVWQALSNATPAGGPAWGPDGTLAFRIEGLRPTGSTVALLAPGSSTPQLVHVSADVLAPLAWTTDGSAIIAKGDLVNNDVAMFRITALGDTRIALGGLHLYGGKWLDVPVAIVGQRIVFDAAEGIFAVMPDGSGLTRLSVLAGTPPGVTFAPGPDGSHVAVSRRADIRDLGVTDKSTRLILGTAGGGGIMSWQPVR